MSFAQQVMPKFAPQPEDDEKSALLATIVECSDDAIISKSLDGTILSWNAGAERLFGYSPAEVIHRPISLLIPENLQKEEEYILSQLQQGKSLDHYETVRLHKNGQLIDISLTVSPIRNRWGNITGASKVARDITQRKQAEKELENFAYLLVHDLKAPLRTIQGFVGIIEKALQSDDINIHAVTGHCRRVANIAKRMDLLIDTLHLYTKMNEKVAFEPVEMRQVMDDTLSNLASLIQEYRVCVTHDALPAVIGNAPQLIQLLQNLIGNSVKYCKEIPAIHISAKRQDKNIWLFTAQDNGIGIPKEYYQQVFEPFRRLHAAEKYEGSGLGLATCKKIVERHGGSIWCESAKGQGTVFSFTLQGARGPA